MYSEIDMKNLRTIREVAQETGLSTDTLRYYERIGLISDILRASNGHRRYGDADIFWIFFLKQLRATGMPISQMQHFAQLRREGDTTVTQRREMLEQHRKKLQEQVQSLKDFMSVIDFKIARHRKYEQQELEEKQNE